MTLGAQLKTAREKKGYTLKQLSEISGLSIGFISQVERGQTDPSLSSLKNLATALDIKLRDLFDPDEAAHVLVRRGEGNMLKIDAKVQCELLASSLTKTMEPMIKSIMPGGESGLVSAHAGEEFIYVLEGVLQVQLDETFYLLEKGDSVYFQANQTHAWKNVGDKECLEMWVMTPPCYS